MIQNADIHPLKHEFKETFSLSIPLIGSWLIYSFSGFIGTAFVAHLGEDALAASVLVATMWMTIMVFFIGIFSSVSIMVSHQYGARNYVAISNIFGQALLLSLASCIPILLAISALPLILRATSQTDTVLALAIEYAHAMAWSAPWMILLVTFEHFLNGLGRTKLSLWISILEVPFEILFIYIFIFGKCGIPAFGIAGVGYGFAAAYSITVVGVLIYLYYARFAQPLGIFKNIFAIRKSYLKEIIVIGLPIGIMYLIEVLALAFATFLMARFSTITLAAHQIVMQYLGFTINAAYAISQAVSIRIGHYAGKRDKTGVRQASYVGMLLSFVIMSVISLFYVLFPKLLLRIDINVHDTVNADLVKTAVSMMMVLSVFQLFDSIRIVEVGVLRGLKDTRASMYVSIISFWLIGIASAYLFAFIFHWQGIGIWLGLTVGVAAGASLLFIRMRSVLDNLDFSSSR